MRRHGRVEAGPRLRVMKLRLIVSLALLSLIVGCESRSTARAKARAAYAAGRAAAHRQIDEEQRTSIRVIGDVNTSEFEWEEGMTLARVLLVAEYQNKGEPRKICIDRRGLRIPVNMKAFLKGHDVVLEPGDIVEINQ